MPEHVTLTSTTAARIRRCRKTEMSPCGSASTQTEQHCNRYSSRCRRSTLCASRLELL